MFHSSGQGRAAWASNDDYAVISLAIVVIGLAFGAYQLWIHYHAEIAWGVFQLQHWKMQIIARLTSDYAEQDARMMACLLYTSPSPRDKRQSRMPSSA